MKKQPIHVMVEVQAIYCTFNTAYKNKHNKQEQVRMSLKLLYVTMLSVWWQKLWLQHLVVVKVSATLTFISQYD